MDTAIGEHARAVLREALTNVARHAHAHRVEVRVGTSDDRFLIEVAG